MRGFKSKPYYIFVSDDRVLIAGVLALDDLKTPEREGKNLVGGAGIYSSLSSCIFTNTSLVGPVGTDFPFEVLERMKEKGIDMEIFRLDEKRTSYCVDVKADWDKRKIQKTEASEEQKQILKAQEQIKKEQSFAIKCVGNDYKQWTNCTGSYTTNTGHNYNGLFKNGKILKGTALFPGGATYVGEFEDYKPHGYGNFAWANGDKYYGEWKNGKNHGNGTNTQARRGIRTGRLLKHAAVDRLMIAILIWPTRSPTR